MKAPIKSEIIKDLNKRGYTERSEIPHPGDLIQFSMKHIDVSMGKMWSRLCFRIVAPGCSMEDLQMPLSSPTDDQYANHANVNVGSTALFVGYGYCSSIGYSYDPMLAYVFWMPEKKRFAFNYREKDNVRYNIISQVD
jgi:hypothetical protein